MQNHHQVFTFVKSTTKPTVRELSCLKRGHVAKGNDKDERDK